MKQANLFSEGGLGCPRCLRPRMAPARGCASGLHPEDRFDGKTYEKDRDQVRLSGQLGKVYDLMRDGEWRTLRQIRDVIGSASETSVSARLRDLRKRRFGSHQVARKEAPGMKGLFLYRLGTTEAPHE